MLTIKATTFTKIYSRGKVASGGVIDLWASCDKNYSKSYGSSIFSILISHSTS